MSFPFISAICAAVSLYVSVTYRHRMSRPAMAFNVAAAVFNSLVVAYWFITIGAPVAAS